MKILYICTGNTCRSPIAEAITKQMNLENVSVRSAGIFAAVGQDASPLAKQVLKENQIEFQHQASQVTKTDVEWADLILTMTKSHKQMLVQQFPGIEEKVFTLKHYVDETDGDIIDPFGGTIDTYRETFNELQQLIVKLGEKLSD